MQSGQEGSAPPAGPFPPTPNPMGPYPDSAPAQPTDSFSPQPVGVPSQPEASFPPASPAVAAPYVDGTAPQPAAPDQPFQPSPPGSAQPVPAQPQLPPNPAQFAPAQPSSFGPAQPMPAQPGYPVMPAPGKKKTGMLIGIIAGVVALVGGGVILLLVVLGGDKLSCSNTSSFYGQTMITEVTYHFGGSGGIVSTVDMKITFKSPQSVDVDDAYKMLQSSVGGNPKVSVRKQGSDTIVVEGKGLTSGDSMFGTSIPAMSGNRTSVKKEAENAGFVCK